MRLTVNQDVVGSSPASGAKISESYNGSTAVSKTVSVGSIPTSGAKMYSVNLVFSTTVERDGSIPSW